MNKFRAYDTFNNKMYYPDGNGYFFDEFSHDEFVIDGLGEPIFLSDMSTPEGMVLMRSVGISDVTGKDIYESDVLKVTHNNKIIYESIAVVYSDKWASFMLVAANDLSWYIQRYYEFEVIGNIHENPELL